LGPGNKGKSKKFGGGGVSDTLASWEKRCSKGLLDDQRRRKRGKKKTGEGLGEYHSKTTLRGRQKRGGGEVRRGKYFGTGRLAWEGVQGPGKKNKTLSNKPKTKQ